MVPRSCCVRSFWLGAVLSPLLLLLVVFTATELSLSAIGRWLAQPALVAPADAIVVLSGGGPERMMQGVVLYQQGLTLQLWYTGDVPLEQMRNFTDGQLARRFALDQGVPADAIRLLPTTSTWEDAREIAARVRQNNVRSILVVTSWYHSRRALCVIRRHLVGTGVLVSYSSPPMLTYTLDDWWQKEDGLVAVVNEVIKFGLYWQRYGLAPWEC